MTNTSTLRKDFSNLLTHSYGDDCEFKGTQSFAAATQDHLIFIQAADDLNPHAAAVITTEAVAQEIKDSFKGFIGCVADVRLAQALIKQAYDDYESRDPEWPDVHASAIVHDSAQIGKGVRLGPNVVIGRGVILGDHVIVRSNSVIEFDSVIGTGSIINTGVMVGHGSQIGKNVILKSGAVIGNEGFGFAQTKDKAYVRIPHTGNVVLEDDVFVGCNSCIDRGTYGSTIIRRGVKIDNLCHVAHNVVIDEDCLLIAQSGIAGSSKLGKRVIASGQTGILDHKTIADDAVLVHRAGIIEDIPSGGLWGGLPPKPFREHMRRNNLDTLVDKRMAKLEAKIAELSAKLKN